MLLSTHLGLMQLRLAQVFTMVMISAMFSCDDDNSSSGNTAAVENTLLSDTWRITYFFDDGDETNHFTGYTFTFQEGGEVSATKTGSTVDGTWSVTSSSSGGLKLNLDFGTTTPFDELNDDWKIVERTDTRIRLEDVSGGSGETDYLTFERN